MIKYLLDTNICIYTIKNKAPEIREQFRRHHGQMAISTVTLMELVYGAEKSQAPERNLTEIEGFSARLEVLEYGSEAARHTGQLRAELARIGKSIGPYDQMIAGHARSLGLIIVTNNLREFERVPGLRVVDWVEQHLS
ncbi:VapC toxin family PIN domain ribonuclease [Acidithiobacillus marinus]|uniref:Ribonuclease VapC n=1 Tax=Acidithiobacillus marinus TaxID=187490 RepID=A0A2I1DJA3_9PROT|nr:tRNA(fMet)-specific endonuclease VapC [Acidithiobacillus marinus]PKY09943.1 VapC toxin family PIN domain ribonuclease [Acidithiobacillus marinus]